MFRTGYFHEKESVSVDQVVPFLTKHVLTFLTIAVLFYDDTLSTAVCGYACQSSSTSDASSSQALKSPCDSCCAPSASRDLHSPCEEHPVPPSSRAAWMLIPEWQLASLRIPFLSWPWLWSTLSPRVEMSKVLPSCGWVVSQQESSLVLLLDSSATWRTWPTSSWSPPLRWSWEPTRSSSHAPFWPPRRLDPRDNQTPSCPHCAGAPAVWCSSRLRHRSGESSCWVRAWPPGSWCSHTRSTQPSFWLLCSDSPELVWDGMLLNLVPPVSRGPTGTSAASLCARRELSPRTRQSWRWCRLWSLMASWWITGWGITFERMSSWGCDCEGVMSWCSSSSSTNVLCWLWSPISSLWCLQTMLVNKPISLVTNLSQSRDWSCWQNWQTEFCTDKRWQQEHVSSERLPWAFLSISPEERTSYSAAKFTKAVALFWAPANRLPFNGINKWPLEAASKGTTLRSQTFR